MRLDLQDRVRRHAPTALWQLSSSSLSCCSIIRASLCTINPVNHCYSWQIKHYKHRTGLGVSACRYQLSMCEQWPRIKHPDTPVCVLRFKWGLMCWHEMKTIDCCGRLTWWISVCRFHCWVVTKALNLLRKVQRNQDGFSQTVIHHFTVHVLQSHPQESWPIDH